MHEPLPKSKNVRHMPTCSAKTVQSLFQRSEFLRTFSKLERQTGIVTCCSNNVMSNNMGNRLVDPASRNAFACCSTYLMPSNMAKYRLHAGLKNDLAMLFYIKPLICVKQHARDVCQNQVCPCYIDITKSY